MLMMKVAASIYQPPFPLTISFGLFEPFGGKRINNFKGHADAHDDDDDDGDGDGDCDDGDGDGDHDDDDDDDDAWHKQG